MSVYKQVAYSLCQECAETDLIRYDLAYVDKAVMFNCNGALKGNRQTEEGQTDTEDQHMGDAETTERTNHS